MSWSQQLFHDSVLIFFGVAVATFFLFLSTCGFSIKSEPGKFSSIFFLDFAVKLSKSKCQDSGILKYPLRHG